MIKNVGQDQHQHQHKWEFLVANDQVLFNLVFIVFLIRL